MRSSIKAVILPPGSLFVIAFAGCLIRRRWPRLGRGMTIGAVTLLFLLSLPAIGAWLIHTQQSSPSLDPGTLPDGSGAIVVLSAGTHPDGAEYGGPTVGPLTLERVRYGAWLANLTSLPVLAAGGPTRPGAPTHADVMSVAFREFGVDVRWVEDRSRTTRENANFTAEILAENEIDWIVLVTHAWHIPRATAAFERVGLEVFPAPTSYAIYPRRGLRAYLPSVQGLRESHWAFREMAGRVWYALSG